MNSGIGSFCFFDCASQLTFREPDEDVLARLHLAGSANDLALGQPINDGVASRQHGEWVQSFQPGNISLKLKPTGIRQSLSPGRNLLGQLIQGVPVLLDRFARACEMKSVFHVTVNGPQFFDAAHEGQLQPFHPVIEGQAQIFQFSPGWTRRFWR